jgi:predicted O-linked N-acetylglucosamine transferase (SPINDLY family)
MLTEFDREAFEVYAFSNSVVADQATALFQQNVTVWRAIAGMSDEAVAELIRADEIDILVDLSGHSGGNRLLVFARKPAPIQITAWGYIGGTGMKAMDVFFADEVVVPPEERALYAEEVRYLPSVVCYYPFEPFPPVNALPALMGRGLTFGSFNRLAKITEASFRVWAEVLLAVPHSRMVLKTPELDQLSEQERIRDRFVAYGVAPERVVLLGRTSWAEHVAAFNQVDIGLDPFPHGGGVTALEGLMMGVPVVTLKWPTIPGRLSAAILTPLGLTDWIADSPEAYVRIAVEKSRDLMALSVLRKQLRGRMTSSLIGDPKAYARAVESEYRLLWQEWCAR